MRLVTPSLRWHRAFDELARECEAAGEQRYRLAIQDFGAYLRKLQARRNGEGMSESRVPVAERWLEDEGRIVACVRIRLRLTADLEVEGGHIGYDVRPSMRGRGYGRQLLRLALIEARALGIRRVRITCDDDNLPSIRVIERNGGVLAGRGVESGKPIRQYWVESELRHDH